MSGNPDSPQEQTERAISVMVVEEDALVRRFCQRVLRRGGFAEIQALRHRGSVAQRRVSLFPYP